jgi:hypothetical protein
MKKSSNMGSGDDEINTASISLYQYYHRGIIGGAAAPDQSLRLSRRRLAWLGGSEQSIKGHEGTRAARARDDPQLNQ